MNKFVITAVDRLGNTIAAGDEHATAAIAKYHSDQLTKLVDLAGAVIHGQENVLGQTQIDGLFPEQP
jgi:hypothetical protein